MPVFVFVTAIVAAVFAGVFFGSDKSRTGAPALDWIFVALLLAYAGWAGYLLLAAR